ncbi:transcription antitermination factor NusB [Bulleidia sp. HCP3S3_F2]|jgi:N utilization substance protein B|uniref:transcription antitermination factor NusB n=1 Tax=unclassified Bulleidia TaxID=2704656 RepID=UPI002A882A87|nr:transcription antitermination factor NusB [Erysipelotrichaceae bacterium]MDD7058389.1 transcription antitermination factor NusB [Erysipelotrichaceae bacterium]MDY3659551.1 transcription antitermination factor NusB [Bulleidia sp.]MEE0558075.1 transcription antitermination factor NusB [Bulleidia sp.]
MNRSELREKAMITVYQYLLVKRDTKQLIEDAFEMEQKDIPEYFVKVIHTAIDNEEKYKGYINEVIKKGWSYDRLGAIEKAILINGCAEFDLKEVEAAVIINESVELAKKYCDEDTYKLINRILDVI